MGFWDDERCEYCNGLIIEKIVDLLRKVGEKYILIKAEKEELQEIKGVGERTAVYLKLLNDTLQIKDALQTVGISLQDHLVIAGDEYFSYRQTGYLE